jgi:hypothetical protein
MNTVCKPPTVNAIVKTQAADGLQSAERRVSRLRARTR